MNTEQTEAALGASNSSDLLAGIDMAEKINKAETMKELTRRIDWFEKNYGFSPEKNSIHDMAENPNKLIMYGRYLALTEARHQLNCGAFIGGFAC